MRLHLCGPQPRHLQAQLPGNAGVRHAGTLGNASCRLCRSHHTREARRRPGSTGSAHRHPNLTIPYSPSPAPTSADYILPSVTAGYYDVSSCQNFLANGLKGMHDYAKDVGPQMLQRDGGCGWCCC